MHRLLSASFLLISMTSTEVFASKFDVILTAARKGLAGKSSNVSHMIDDLLGKGELKYEVNNFGPDSVANVAYLKGRSYDDVDAVHMARFSRSKDFDHATYATLGKDGEISTVEFQLPAHIKDRHTLSIIPTDRLENDPLQRRTIMRVHNGQTRDQIIRHDTVVIQTIDGEQFAVLTDTSFSVFSGRNITAELFSKNDRFTIRPRKISVSIEFGVKGQKDIFGEYTLPSSIEGSVVRLSINDTGDTLTFATSKGWEYDLAIRESEPRFIGRKSVSLELAHARPLADGINGLLVKVKTLAKRIDASDATRGVQIRLND